MASAYHILSQRVYRDASWNQLMTPTPHEDKAPTPEIPEPPVAPSSTTLSNTSWLAQQRGALAGALRFTRK